VLLKEMQSLALDVNVAPRRAPASRSATRTTTCCARPRSSASTCRASARRAADAADEAEEKVEAEAKEADGRRPSRTNRD
jgi:hypothetical protein